VSLQCVIRPLLTVTARARGHDYHNADLNRHSR
jgi:hypothetical protein